MFNTLKLLLFFSNGISKSKNSDLKSTINTIALVTISIGIATILLSVFVLKGFTNEIHNKCFSFSGHITVKKFTANSNSVTPISYNSKFYKNYSQLPAIQHVQGIAYKEGLIENKKNKVGKKRIGGMLLKGIDSTWNNSFFNESIIKGTLPDYKTTSNKTDIIISQKLANDLSFDVGDNAYLTFIGKPPKYRKVKICGIYETGIDEFEDIAICNLSLLQSLNKWDKDKVTIFEVFLYDFNSIDNVYNTLENRSDILTSDLYASRITEQYQSTFEWLNLLNYQVKLFILLILFIATFNMASVFFVIIMDNANKIGLLKTLGATNGLIRYIFLANGTRIISVGLIMGNSIALLLSYLQYKYKVIPLDYDNYFMHYVPISWEWGAMLTFNIVIIADILLSLLIPTQIISTIKPKVAMSFD